MTMTSLSQTDLENLSIDLGNLNGSLLVGIMVGAGSIVLHFSNRSTLLVQCPYEAYDGGVPTIAHGELPETSTILFRFLNQRVTDTSVDGLRRATIEFGTGRRIRVSPDNSGFEAYVLSTSKGVFPVH